jgi:hypothetical protein
MVGPPLFSYVYANKVCVNKKEANWRYVYRYTAHQDRVTY